MTALDGHPDRGPGGETVVHVLDVESGDVYRASAPAGGRGYLGALARALGEARRAR